MPAKRYVVYPQGGGAKTVAPPYVASNDPGFLRGRRVASLARKPHRTKIARNTYFTSPFGSSAVTSQAGVAVGANGRLVSTTDGTTVVYLTGCGLHGMEQGTGSNPAGSSPNTWLGCAAVSSAQWAQGLQYWYNWLLGNQGAAVAAKYGIFNHLRVQLNSAAYMGLSGLDPGGNGSNPPASSAYRTLGTNANGHIIYCAGDTGGTLGTTDGTETPGSYNTYRTFVDNIVVNFLGASVLLGYTTYVTLCNSWDAMVLAATNANGVTNQYVLPTSQPAWPSPVGLSMLQVLAAKYGQNQCVLFELFNEPYGSNSQLSTDPTRTTESTLLGQGGNSGTGPFVWPNATTIGQGGPSSYIVNFGSAIAQGSPCLCESFQHMVNVLRSGGAKNVLICGCMVATEALNRWSENGGTQVVTDPLTINGHQQLAAALHAYGFNGAATGYDGAGVANITGLINGGKPVLITEYGTLTQVGSTAANGYTWIKANGVSGHSWDAWANYSNLTNIYPNSGGAFTANWSILGENPWYNPNVPVGNTGSTTSQIPNGSN